MHEFKSMNTSSKFTVARNHEVGLELFNHKPQECTYSSPLLKKVNVVRIQKYLTFLVERDL